MLRGDNRRDRPVFFNVLLGADGLETEQSTLGSLFLEEREGFDACFQALGRGRATAPFLIFSLFLFPLIVHLAGLDRLVSDSFGF